MALFKTAALGSISAIVLAGCSVDPRNFETTPVQVKTAKGIVTCQLYTKERVLWDRAIDRPDNMSVREADDVCRAEGIRQQDS
ncbi:hypothetical protein [Roseovarius rhodophyticola]|uniref:Uncharacterized protein n=1 Tax=Roseovarius rhodophyticola TaxID=3080827 RepID=A0ABZ2TAG0_9RHOB|nr:hypothetical protein [Roseovarius sp. W115]MDV2930385.1 hypothetical protein [Roseovarius sp. W115]